MVLLRILEREAALVTRFVGILAQEQEILIKGKPQELEPLSEAKTPLIDELMALAAQRDEALRAEGFPADAEGLRTWVTLQGNADLDSTYAALKQASGEAKRLNLLNASLVNSRLQITQQALSVLLPGENAAALYDTQGQSAQKVGYKLIDSA